MKNILMIIQIIFSIILVGLILMQSKGAGLGSIFGGSGGLYSTKRGVEKTIYYLTIIVVILFFVSSLVQLLIF